MSRAISLNEIVDLVLNGIVQAEADYRKWSDGQWLWSAPEYLLTTSIAQQLGGKDKCHLEMEKNVFELLKEAQVDTWDESLRKGRCDIALYFKDSYPRGVIEVKNQLRTEGPCEEDVKRISQMLVANPESSTLQFGIFAFYSSAKAPQENGESLETKLNKIHEWIEKRLPSQLIHEWYEIPNSTKDNGDWTANCLLITRQE